VNRSWFATAKENGKKGKSRSEGGEEELVVPSIAKNIQANDSRPTEETLKLH